MPATVSTSALTGKPSSRSQASVCECVFGSEAPAVSPSA